MKQYFLHKHRAENQPKNKRAYTISIQEKHILRQA